MCGDGEIDGHEACDDGINDGAYGGCQPGCGALGPTCGDGNVDEGEGCDDGNVDDGDGCSTTCVASGTALWSVSVPGWETLDMVNLAEGGVRVALSNRDLDVDELSLRTLSLEGELVDEFVFDDIWTGAPADLHTSGRLLVQRGLELRSYEQDTPLWTLELPFSDPITTVRHSIASGDGGAFWGLRDYAGGSSVQGFDANGDSLWQAEFPERLLDMELAANGSALTLTSASSRNGMTVTSYLPDGDIEFSADLPALIHTGRLRASSSGLGICWRREDGDTYGAASLSGEAALEWSDSFGEPEPLETSCLDVAVLEGGDLVVLELVRNKSTFERQFILRRIAEGESVWAADLDVPSNSTNGRVLEGPEDKLLIALSGPSETVIQRLEP